MSTYKQLNKELHALLFARKSRFDLDEIKKIYHSLKLKKYPIVHVAGTNGKGSCVEKVSSTLTCAGYRCGQYFSPHITSFRERIRIDGKMISQDEVVQYLPSILKLKSTLTFFEVATLLALLYFSEMNVDVAVFEVGLGGRLDATNCIDPFLTVITSIGFDHQNLLGNTLEEIASEKAGIIKPNIPVVLGPTSKQESIRKKIEEQRAPVIQVEGVFQTYDLENKAIARAALEELQKTFEISNASIEKGLLKKPPCRFEEVDFQNRALILDMSHNEEGLNYLFKEINHKYPKHKKIVFYSVSQGHDLKKTSGIIEQNADQIYLLDAPHTRLFPAKEIEKSVEGTYQILPIEEALKEIQKLDPKALFIFTGSIFIMAPIRKDLGLDAEGDLYPIADGSFNFR